MDHHLPWWIQNLVIIMDNAGTYFNIPGNQKNNINTLL